jgi:hypothetical protein
VDPNEELVPEYAIHPTQLGKTQSVAQWPVRTTSNQQTIAENGTNIDPHYDLNESQPCPEVSTEGTWPSGR